MINAIPSTIVPHIVCLVHFVCTTLLTSFIYKIVKLVVTHYKCAVPKPKTGVQAANLPSVAVTIQPYKFKLVN